MYDDVDLSQPRYDATLFLDDIIDDELDDEIILVVLVVGLLELLIEHDDDELILDIIELLYITDLLPPDDEVDQPQYVILILVPILAEAIDDLADEEFVDVDAFQELKLKLDVIDVFDNELILYVIDVLHGMLLLEDEVDGIDDDDAYTQDNIELNITVWVLDEVHTHIHHQLVEITPVKNVLVVCH